MLGPLSTLSRIEVEGFGPFHERATLDIEGINVFISKNPAHHAILFNLIQFFQYIIREGCLDDISPSMVLKHRLITLPGTTFTVALTMRLYDTESDVRHVLTYAVNDDLSWELTSHLSFNQGQTDAEPINQMINNHDATQQVTSEVVGEGLLHYIGEQLARMKRRPLLGNPTAQAGADARKDTESARAFYATLTREMLHYVLDVAQPFRRVWLPFKTTDFLNLYPDWFQICQALDPRDTEWELDRDWRAQSARQFSAQSFNFDALTDFSPKELDLTRVLLSFSDWSSQENRPVEVRSAIDRALSTGDQNAIRTLLSDMGLVMSEAHDAIERYGSYDVKVQPLKPKKPTPMTEKEFLVIGPTDFAPIEPIINLDEDTWLTELLVSLMGRVEEDRIIRDEKHRVNFFITSSLLKREVYFQFDLIQRSVLPLTQINDELRPFAELDFEEQKVFFLELLFEDDLTVFLSHIEAGLSDAWLEVLGKKLVRGFYSFSESPAAAAGFRVHAREWPPIFVDTQSAAFVAGVQQQLSSLQEAFNSLGEEETTTLQLVECVPNEADDAIKLASLGMTTDEESTALLDPQFDLSTPLTIHRITEAYRDSLSE